jgi:hypothetical protein
VVAATQTQSGAWQSASARPLHALAFVGVVAGGVLVVCEYADSDPAARNAVIAAVDKMRMKSDSVKGPLDPIVGLAIH